MKKGKRREIGWKKREKERTNMEKGGKHREKVVKRGRGKKGENREKE